MLVLYFLVFTTFFISGIIKNYFRGGVILDELPVQSAGKRLAVCR